LLAIIRAVKSMNDPNLSSFIWSVDDLLRLSGALMHK